MMTSMGANKTGGQHYAGGAVRSKSFLRSLPGMHWPGPRRSFIFSSSSNSGDGVTVSGSSTGGGGSDGLSIKAKNALVDDRFDPLPHYGPASYADRTTHPLLRRRSCSTGNLDDYGNGGAPHGLAASSNSSQSSGCSSSNGSHQHHLKALGNNAGGSSRDTFRQSRSMSCRNNFQNGGGGGGGDSLSQSCGSGWISARQRANSAGGLVGGRVSARSLYSSRSQDDDTTAHNDDDSYVGHYSFGEGWSSMSNPTATVSHPLRHGSKKMSNKELMLQQQQQQQLQTSAPLARRVNTGPRLTQQGRTERDSLEGGGAGGAKSGGTSTRNLNNSNNNNNPPASSRNLNGAAPSSRNLNTAAPSSRNLNAAAPSARNLNATSPSSRNLHTTAPSLRNLSTTTVASLRNINGGTPVGNDSDNNDPDQSQGKDSMKSILEDMSKKLEMAEKVRKHQQRLLHQSSKRDVRTSQENFGNTPAPTATTTTAAPLSPAPAKDDHPRILPPMMDMNHSARSSSKASCASSMGSPPHSPTSPCRLRAQSCPDVAPLQRTPSQAAAAANAAAAAAGTRHTPSRASLSGPLPVSMDAMAFQGTNGAKTTPLATAGGPQQDSKSIWEAFCALEEMTLRQQSKLAKLQAQMEEQTRVIAERDREINELHQERSLLKASYLKLQKIQQTSESEIEGLQRELTKSMTQVEEVELQRDEEQVRNTRLRRKLLDLANDLRLSHVSTTTSSSTFATESANGTTSSPTPSIMTAQEEHDKNNLKNNNSSRSSTAMSAVDLAVADPASPLANVVDKLARTEQYAKTA